jgi:hypothetical protein
MTTFRQGQDVAVVEHDDATRNCYRMSCAESIKGTPVTEPGDPSKREWCSEDCHIASAEDWHEQHYRTG